VEKEDDMLVATISSKGQITLPSSMRRKLGIKDNSRVFIEQTEDKIIIKKTPDFWSIKHSATFEREREAAIDGAIERAMGKK
jgi:AbrB family looped-hinge helix DNA binding protein